jgi:lipoprotein-anchoring transpeptidase ErfK/SrfK
VKRFGFAVCALACAAAGALTSVVLAGGVSAAALLTTGPTGTTIGTTTPPELIPPGVMISRVPVGGLTPEDAAFVVRERFESPLPLILDRRHRLAPVAGTLGASAHIEEAVARARVAQPGAEVQLPVTIDGRVVRNYVVSVARRYNRKATDAQVFLRRLRPVIVPDRPSLLVNRPLLTQAIVARLRATSRVAVKIRTTARPATTTRSVFRSVIVIRRGSNRLLLYRYDRLRRSFRVATGQSVYPTPLGRFRMLVKWRNPWWYPPNSRWARGQKPIPPGPSNPLGTRWMGLSAPGVGIHGTPNPASIGYSVSHGCIRMYISDAEWLFNVVDVGTTVFIVSQ